MRLANSTIEFNADGRGDPSGDRVGRGDNAPGNVFVRASTPVIVGNDFANSDSAALTFDVNSLNSQEVNDPGRSSGTLDRVDVVGNTGPLIQNNSLTNNAINGLVVRGGQLVDRRRLGRRRHGARRHRYDRSTLTNISTADYGCGATRVAAWS